VPLTLYRYILWELFKLLALSTTVLVLVISFAATIKPLSDGLLSPIAMLKFIGYTAPTMLTFALPFSGAFAATLLFIRLASDNEVQACAASGISYRSILFPVAALGLTLTMGLFFLSNYVIPGFYKGAARTIEADVMTLLVGRLNEDQAFSLGEAVIHAEAAAFGDVSALPDAVGNPRQHIMLEGVTVNRLGPDGRPASTATAKRADVLVYNLPSGSGVQMNLQNVVYLDPLQGQLVRQDRYPVPLIRIPGLLRDKPKFLSMPELRRLRQNPERFEAVARHRDDVVRAILEKKLFQTLEQQLPTDAGLTFIGPIDGEEYRLSAPIIDRNGPAVRLMATDDQPVRLERRAPGVIPRRYQARSAELELAPDAPPDRAVMVGELNEVRTVDARAGRLDNERRVMRLPRLTLAQPLLDRPANDTTYQQALAMARADGSPPVLSAAREMIERVQLLGRRVLGHVNDRAASSVACLLLMLMGSLLAILNRGQLPLVVYFWSFLAAIFVVVLINVGQRTTGTEGSWLAGGLALLWSGNAALVAIVAFLYERVARH